MAGHVVLIAGPAVVGGFLHAFKFSILLWPFNLTLPLLRDLPRVCATLRGAASLYAAELRASREEIRADLLRFAARREHYARVGRAWKRGYLLHGPPGTGKSTFAAAMARFLGYDVYDVDLSRADVVDLRALLMHTTPRSLILVEDLDRHLQLQGHGAEARVLSFMDGVSSWCG